MGTRRNITRREFGSMIAGSAVAAAVAPAIRPVGASEKVGIGLIGCGGRGLEDIRNFVRRPDVEILAVCDVDSLRLEGAKKAAGGKAAVYKDFRNLLEKKDIDAVIIATPDHWHALSFIYACAAGKDVYCEKPLAVTIYEGQKMVEAARKYGRVTQCGTQQHSGPHYREAVEFLQKGGIGKISKVLCWNYSNGGSLGHAQPSPTPPNLDWDFWLGPAPSVPYIPQRCHGSFRFFWDYSGGTLTDWGTHHFDIIQWALQQDYPLSVVSEGGKLAIDDCRETPDTQEVVCEYRGCLVQFSLRSGNAHDPAHPNVVPGTWSGYGIEFYGADGTLFIDRNHYQVFSENRPDGRAVTPVDRLNPHREREMDNNHVADFINNIRKRGRCVCDVEVCHRATSTPHLGNIALRAGERIVWDGKAERITNHPEINSWLRRQYRDPWKL